MKRVPVASLVLSVIAGCSARPDGPRAQLAAHPREAQSAGEIARFLPLQHDTVYSYTAWLPESPQPEQLILQVERHAPDRANLRSGNSIKRIEFLPDGARLLTGGYLLKKPLEVGAEWGGPAGQVRITAMDQTIRVAAGQFVGCLETIETGAQGSARSIVTTYCPDVGIVKFSVDDGEREERFELKAFGPRVDINQL